MNILRKDGQPTSYGLALGYIRRIGACTITGEHGSIMLTYGSDAFCGRTYPNAPNVKTAEKWASKINKMLKEGSDPKNIKDWTMQ